jgi:hypothetical protein
MGYLLLSPCSNTSYIFDTIATSISFIRSVTALVTCLQTFYARTTKFESSTALAKLLLSLIPPVSRSIRSSLRVVVYLSRFNFFCAILAMGITSLDMYVILGGATVKYHQTKWSLVGGNCPVTVNFCPLKTLFYTLFEVQGCGFENFKGRNGDITVDPSPSGTDHELFPLIQSLQLVGVLQYFELVCKRDTLVGYPRWQPCLWVGS